MDQEKKTLPSSRSDPNSRCDTEISLVYYGRIIYRYRRFIVLALLTVEVGTLAVCLLRPKIYESTATLIAPEDRAADFGSVLAVSGLAQSASALPLPSLTPNRDFCLGVLKSRSLRDEVVAHFGLERVYKVNNAPDAAKQLEQFTRVSVNKEGVISITVEHPGDPETAAQVANFYVTALGERLVRFNSSDVSRHRAFIESRLQQTAEELRQAEEGLREFKEENKIFALEDQARTTAAFAQILRTDIALLETQLEVQKERLSPSNPALHQLDSLLTSKKRQLGEIQYGSGLLLDDTTSTEHPTLEEIHVPPIALPELSLQLGRLMRAVVFKEKVYALLVQELEKAKINERQDPFTFKVLDNAIPPFRKSRPRTFLNLLLCGAGGLIVAVIAAFAIEYVREVRSALAIGSSQLRASSREQLPANGSILARTPEVECT